MGSYTTSSLKTMSALSTALIYGAVLRGNLNGLHRRESGFDKQL